VNAPLRDDLILGIPRLDEQHRELLALVLELPEQPGPEFDATVQQLVSYSSEHFAEEDAFMDEIGFPQREEHVRKHATFFAQFSHFHQTFAAGRITYASFRLFVTNLVTRHILDEDAKIAAFYRKA
jgi:hemerythrin